MTNPSVTGIQFDSQDSGGLEKWPVKLGFASGDRPFFQTPLNPSSQVVSPVILVTSHYLYNVTVKYFNQLIDNKKE